MAESKSDPGLEDSRVLIFSYYASLQNSILIGLWGESYKAGVDGALQTVEDGAPDGALLS